MRRIVLMGAVVAVGLAGSFSTARAQLGNSSSGDPFFLYYGFVLPRQQALANQVGAEQYINSQASARVQAASEDRSALFERQVSPFDEESDPLRPFGQQRTRSPRGGAVARGGSTSGYLNENLRGTGSPRYFNRTGGYYTNVRTGRFAAPGPVVRSGSRGGGGVPSAGAGMSGARSGLGVPGAR